MTVNKEIYDKLKAIQKEYEKDDKPIDEKADAELLEDHEGPDLGPRNDIEYQKLIKEIRELDDE